VAKIMETAAQLFRATLLKCLPLSMLAVLVLEIPNLYWIANGHALNFHGWLWPSDPTYAVLQVVTAAVALYLASAMMLQQRSLAGGLSCTGLVALRLALRRLPLLLASWVLANLSLAVGLSLLLLPGLFLLVCYLLMLPVVLFEQRNPYMMLVRCVVLVRPQWWKTLAAAAIAVLVILVCVLTFAAILSVFAVLLPGAAFQAVAAACFVAFLAAAGVFLSALVLMLHSAASYSAAASSSA
jgi:hypothetical protein